MEFFAALPSGTLVACGVEDEAQSNMSAAAKDAMKTCAWGVVFFLNVYYYFFSKKRVGRVDGGVIWNEFIWKELDEPRDEAI